MTKGNIKCYKYFSRHLIGDEKTFDSALISLVLVTQGVSLLISSSLRDKKITVLQNFTKLLKKPPCQSPFCKELSV